MKPKTKALLENYGYTFLDIEGLEGIEKLDTIREQFPW